MQPLYAFLLIVFLSAPAANADSFTLIRDGKEYQCVATSPSNPGGNIDCVNSAYSWIFTKEEALQLCQGATTIAPASCAKKAYSYILSREESIQLCQRSTSEEEPLNCFKAGYSWILNRNEALNLCSRNGTTANVDCVKKAYSGIYSKEEALRLCKAQPLMMMQTLQLMESSAEFQKMKFMKEEKALRLPLSSR